MQIIHQFEVRRTMNENSSLHCTTFNAALASDCSKIQRPRLDNTYPSHPHAHQHVWTNRCSLPRAEQISPVTTTACLSRPCLTSGFTVSAVGSGTPYITPLDLPRHLVCTRSSAGASASPHYPSLLQANNTQTTKNTQTTSPTQTKNTRHGCRI